MTEALTGLGVMMLLAFLRVPIAIAMGLVGFLGLWWMRGVGPSLASATTVVYESGFQYTLSVVPLFILMGNFVTRAGMSKELYRAAYTFVGHLRGGLAMASVMAALPEGDAFTTFVPAWSDAATLLDDLGFEELDHDVCCTTADVVIPSTAVVLHPALA